GKSVVLDFGDYGTDQMVYLFVANILSRRLFDLYTERNEEFPRLVLFLEEAHKFLSPEIAPYAHTFSRLARETRKFNLILALVDDNENVREHILGAGVVDEGRLQEIAKRADDVFGRG